MRAGRLSDLRPGEFGIVLGAELARALNVYPGDNLDASLVNFIDGGLNLDDSTKQASGVMTSYSIAYSDDGEYGEPGGFVMVGKTFKGLTDAMLEWQTRELLARETGRSGHVVHVRPELVVEIALDGVQRSPRYPGGVALRFARVKGYRDDKGAAEADTIASIRALLRD